MIRNILFAATTMIAISNIAATFAYAEERTYTHSDDILNNSKDPLVIVKAIKTLVTANVCGIIEDKVGLGAARVLGEKFTDATPTFSKRAREKIFNAATNTGITDATPEYCADLKADEENIVISTSMLYMQDSN